MPIASKAILPRLRCHARCVSQRVLLTCNQWSVPFKRPPVSSPCCTGLAATNAAMVATVVLFPEARTRRTRLQLMLTLGIALLSHGVLDALTTYSLGIEFFAPFSQERFRFPWTPLGRPNGQLLNELVLESLVLFLPAVVLAWLGVKRRRRVDPA